jgi:hypothetical protein
MAAPKRLAGPAYLANAATNVYRGGGNGNAAPLIRDVVTHIHLVNKTATAATATLYIDATGGSTGGKEILGGESIPANDHLDLYFSKLELLSADYLVGVSGTASAITITVMGYQEVI